MDNNLRNTNFHKELLYILLTNGGILILALLQHWNPSELLLFLFLQSVLVGFVALGIIVLLKLHANEFINCMLHLIFFLSHYFLFTLIILMAVIYESGYLSFQTLADLLSGLFSIHTNEYLVFITEVNIQHIALSLGLFLLISSYTSFQKYRDFNTLGRTFGEVHLMPYQKHFFIFFMVFFMTLGLIVNFLDFLSITLSSSIFSGVIVSTFFVTLTLIEVLIAYVARKIDLL